MNNTESSVPIAQFLSEQMAALNKTTQDLRDDIGVASANTLSAVLRGDLKLPFKLAAPLAHSLHIDAAHLLRLMLREYAPDLSDAIESETAFPLLSAREKALIKDFRSLTNGRGVRGAAVERDGLLEVLVLNSDSNFSQMGN